MNDSDVVDDDYDPTPRCCLCEGDPSDDPDHLLINGYDFCGLCMDRLVRVGVFDENFNFIADKTDKCVG